MAKKSIMAGIDIGGTTTRMALIDENGYFLKEAVLPTQNFPLFDDFAQEVAAIMQRLLDEVSEEATCQGIGIAVPSVDAAGRLESPANLDWGTVDLKAELAKFFSLPIAVTNDANAAALGEMTYGGARGMQNFLIVTLGTGVGGGVVIDGHVYAGQNGFAGEFGHIIVEPDGRQCRCGRRGCLETYVSATGLLRTVQMMAKDLRKSSLDGLSAEKIDSKVIYQHASNGDPLAIAAFAETGRILGQALANLAAIFDPEAIFLFGGLAEAGELLLKPTQQTFENSLLYLYKGRIALRLTQISQNRGAVLGAGALARRRLSH
ncbi:MAG: ROK family protein [candidate division KSB1 bacterium]|nr:ROK family protein [candidate division KSB1 bacterium]